MRWFTTRYNYWLRCVATRYQTAVRIWFSVGVCCSLLVLPLAVYLALTTVYYQLATVYTTVLVPAKSQQQPNVWAVKFGQSSDLGGSGRGGDTVWTLQSVVPGVNRPLLELPVYLAALLFASVVHELGHALAACRERVTVYGCGVAAIGYLLPVAFVEIDSAQLLAVSSPLAKLRVLCAGVWHNLFTTGVLVLLANVWFTDRVIDGAVVHGVRLNGVSGFRVGDVITSIDDCPVRSSRMWTQCVQKLAQNPPQAFCVTNLFIDDHNAYNHTGYRQNRLDGSSNYFDCCSAHLSASHLCFRALHLSNETGQQQHFYCLPARAVLKTTVLRCDNAECQHSDHICLHVSPPQSPDRLVLIRRYTDSLVFDSRDSKMNQLDSSASELLSDSSLSAAKHKNNSGSNMIHINEDDLHRPVVFFGPMQTLYNSLTIDDSYVNNPTATTTLARFLTNTAHVLSTFAAVSAALVVINVIPTVGTVPLDGHWIWSATIDWLCAVFVVDFHRRRASASVAASFLSRSVCVGGTMLLAVCLLLNFVTILITCIVKL